MGDRCYMEIVCRAQDAPRFEELGFTEDLETGDNGTVKMVDSEFCDFDALPHDVPWHGESQGNYAYGTYEYGCDGSAYSEWETGFTGRGHVLHPVKQTDDDEAVAEELRALSRHLDIVRAAEELVPYPSETPAEAGAEA